MSHDIPSKALSIKQFCKMYNIGTTKFHDLKNNKQIDVRKIGKKTIIPVESAEQWFNNLPKAINN